MAITNRITGESLEQEVEQNQLQSGQPTESTAEPMQESGNSELPTPPKSGRKSREKNTDPTIPPHTAMYLITRAQQEIDSLTKLTEHLEVLLKTAEQTQYPKKTGGERDTVYEQTDEAEAEYIQRFDALCKVIVEQRLSDAEKQGDRLANRLERTVRQATGLRRMLVALLILSGCTLISLVVLLICLN